MKKRDLRKEKWQQITKCRKALDGFEYTYNPFADIYYSNPKQKMLIYPYFQNRLISRECADKEFGFGEKIDWDDNLYKDRELILITGNSQTYGAEGLHADGVISNILEKILNNKSMQSRYKVLNAGVVGATIVNEMLYYILLFQRLKPKYIISISGFDFFTSQFVSEKILKTHMLPYSSYSEKVCKDLFGSDLPLYGESRMLNSKVDIETVVNSFCFRVEQFDKIAKSFDAQLILFLQPFLGCKKTVSASERRGYRKWIVDYGSREWSDAIGRLPLMAKMASNYFDRQGFINYVNLNEYFKDIEEELFIDWIHTNENGNKLIADIIKEKIMQGGK